MLTRRRTTLGAGLLVLASVGPAAARHVDGARPWWDRGPSCAHSHADAGRYRDDHHHAARRVVYRCAPCNHRYESYERFEQHLHHRHHVPFWRIPRVLVRAAFGWIFYG